MKDKIKAMKTQLAVLVAKGKEIAADAEGKTGKDADEQQKLLSQTITDCKKLRDEIADLEYLDSTDGWLNEPEPKAKRKTKDVPDEPEFSNYIKTRNLKSFTRGTMIEREAKAYRFGAFLAASLLNDQKCFEWCVEHGVKMRMEVGNEIREVKTMKESISITGGYLIPVEFDQEMIDLRERYGVFRENARVRTMRGDKLTRSRRTTGLTAYFASEAVAATESEKNWDQVELSAKKLMTYSRISSELAEDALIDVADDLMQESAYAFAAKEDDCGFNGDGTSTYGGIVGARQRLLDIYTASGGVGLIVGSGSTYSTLALVDFNKLVGALPEFAERPDTAWYVSKFFWGYVMVKLANAAGGVTKEEINGKNMRVFQGYPVHISQKMPKTTASGQVCCLFGSLALASDFGDRRRNSFSMTEHRYHETDEIGVRGTERFDINNHSFGDSSEAGPVIGLVTA